MKFMEKKIDGVERRLAGEDTAQQLSTPSRRERPPAFHRRPGLTSFSKPLLDRTPSAKVEKVLRMRSMASKFVAQLEDARTKLELAQQRQHNQFDQRHTAKSFQLEDLV
ncbi:hypothetical protein CYMTET_43844 [Cymbomonas tetramitiformis]|uniref:Uncharacterized protein n=1 Tax=Cymbomonas tetramitiformis TaxID=36881 RepID=A0AAE0F197_9CHLO|nr:hypothetical protein CYMTET_43844 [Cymbomonas tetramitiformis]